MYKRQNAEVPYTIQTTQLLQTTLLTSYPLQFKHLNKKHLD